MSNWLQSFVPAAAAAAAAAAVAAVVTVPGGGAPPVGTAAVLEVAAQRPQRPQRAMILALARAGDRLVAVGEQGVVALSDDHGRTWRAAHVPVGATLTAVRFADARRGWAVGHLGVVLRTDDGGEHWVRQLDGVAIGLQALEQARSAPQGVTAAEAQRLHEDGPDKPLLDLWVHDRDHVMLVGAYNLALATTDGGAHWQLRSRRFDNDKGLHLYGLAEGRDGSRWAVGEQGLVLRSAADESFAAQPSPYDGTLFGVLPTGDGMLAYGLRGHAFVRRDGAADWQRAQLPGSGASINAALRLTDGRVLLADQSGAVFVSADGGLNFERVPYAWGAPITALAQAANGQVVVASVLGMAPPLELPGAAAKVSAR